jgi:hypothetical protein
MPTGIASPRATASLGDVHVDRARLHVLDLSETPDLLEEGAAAHDAAGLVGEQAQHRELGLGDLDARLAGARRAGFRVDGPGAEGEARLQLTRELAGATQQGFDAGEQLLDGEGLRHVVVRAAAKAFEHVVFRALRREHEDRLARDLRPHALADLEAVDAREHQVEEDEPEAAAEGFLEPFLAGLDAERLIAVEGEHVAGPRAEGLFVLDDQDVHAL